MKLKFLFTLVALIAFTCMQAQDPDPKKMGLIKAYTPVYIPAEQVGEIITDIPADQEVKEDVGGLIAEPRQLLVSYVIKRNSGQRYTPGAVKIITNAHQKEGSKLLRQVIDAAGIDIEDLGNPKRYSVTVTGWQYIKDGVITSTEDPLWFKK
jgi:hypothetical protein